MKYSEAIQLYDNGDYEKALSALMEFFDYYKNNLKVLSLIVDCFLRLEKYDEALQYILPKIDGKIFTHGKVSNIVRMAIKASYDNADEQRKTELCDLLIELNTVSGNCIPTYVSLYGQLCRKQKCAQDYLDYLSVIQDENVLQNKYVNDAKLWCLYDVGIKGIKISEGISEDEIELFLKAADSIVLNCSQLSQGQYFNNPYVLTVVKTVKMLNHRASVNYKLIIEWLKKLDVEQLPIDDVKTFTTEFGREVESASTREFYYYQLARAYEKVGEYQECINVCDRALGELQKFHYRNHLWLTARKLFCTCMVADNKKEAIENYKRVVEKHQFWYMYHKLSNIFWNNNQIKEALVYSCKAFDSSQEDKKLINVIDDLSYLFEANGDVQGAKIFAQSYVRIRNKYGWKIRYYARSRAELFGLDVENKDEIKLTKLKTYCDNYLDKILGIKQKGFGEIVCFTKNGFSGFIKQSNGQQIFFNKAQIKNRTEPKIGDRVEFDFSQNDKGDIATNIFIKEKK